VNAISLGNGRKLEDTIAKARNIKGESDKFQGLIAMIESEEPLDKSKVPFPLRLAKTRLEAQFNKFVDMLKKIRINIPFEEACLKCLYMLNFQKIFFQKKGR